ncbi:hypothetical protein [Helicobacter sp. NHP22-001]|uniref:hypothetical protein n=1 Tax=Helicobacter sp. NHP22-001 TaxID=3040202 RepID=UPI002554D42B|nr:hypothetical protein [Helicobacter sp. NHP22-001]
MQSISNQACTIILGAVESIKNEITNLATEFKSSAEYGEELNQAKRQIENLEKNKERLQDEVAKLKQEQETNQQEVERARLIIRLIMKLLNNKASKIKVLKAT